MLFSLLATFATAAAASALGPAFRLQPDGQGDLFYNLHSTLFSSQSVVYASVPAKSGIPTSPLHVATLGNATSNTSVWNVDDPEWGLFLKQTGSTPEFQLMYGKIQEVRHSEGSGAVNYNDFGIDENGLFGWEGKTTGQWVECVAKGDENFTTGVYFGGLSANSTQDTICLVIPPSTISLRVKFIEE